MSSQQRSLIEEVRRTVRIYDRYVDQDRIDRHAHSPSHTPERSL